VFNAVAELLDRIRPSDLHGCINNFYAPVVSCLGLYQADAPAAAELMHDRAVRVRNCWMGRNTRPR